MVSQRYLLMIQSRPSLVLDAAAQRIGASGAFGYEHTLPGVRLFCDDPGALNLSDTVLIFGCLFHRHGPPRRIVQFDKMEREGLERPRDRQLTTDYWGNYLAVRTLDGQISVTRAPFGTLPAFYCERDGGLVFAPDLAALVDHAGVTPSIDWHEVARVHFRRDLPSARTGIVGVRELLPGTTVSLDPDGDHSSSGTWSPWDHVQPAGDPVGLPERLRRAIQNSTAALASDRVRPLLGCSGGLDSSIVAASLATARSDYRCLTLATRSPTGDERVYAQAIASTFRRELLERFYDVADVDFAVSSAGHLPRPTGWIHELAYQRAVRAAAHATGADCFVTGSGGDNVFYNSSSARPVIDHLRCGGSLSAVFGTVGSVARVTGTGRWDVAREAWRVRRLGKTGYQWRCSPDFLRSEVSGELRNEEASHPWLTGSRTHPPGKVGHVAMLVRMLNHMGGFDPDWRLPVLHPLSAQPVVELCLGIPTWQMVSGGIDRALARAAFSQDLPPIILDRRTKGSPEAFVIDLLQARRNDVCERLLDGALVRAGLLDRVAVERSLKPAALATGQDAPTLTGLLDTEAWVARWSAMTGAKTSPP